MLDNPLVKKVWSFVLIAFKLNLKLCFSQVISLLGLKSLYIVYCTNKCTNVTIW